MVHLHRTYPHAADLNRTSRNFGSARTSPSHDQVNPEIHTHSSMMKYVYCDSWSRTLLLWYMRVPLRVCVIRELLYSIHTVVSKTRFMLGSRPRQIMDRYISTREVSTVNCVDRNRTVNGFSSRLRFCTGHPLHSSPLQRDVTELMDFLSCLDRWPLEILLY